MISVSCKLTRGDFRLDVDFEAGPGVLALFGASGSGKTTILNLIAGIERPDHGIIALEGRTLLDTTRGIVVPPYKRRIGFVFQSGELFPHLSVRKNLAFGEAFAPAGMKPLITPEAAVELLGISHLLDRMPATLSGGEAQRVAIGRALLSSPGALLMDEPLASLDEERKREILPFIERLARSISLPIVYVSHSAEEVARLAKTVCRLAGGRIERQGPAQDVLMPRSLARDERLGGFSILRGTVTRHDHEHVMTVVSHPAGNLYVPGEFGRAGDSVQVLVRATNVSLATGSLQGLSIRTALRGTVTGIERGSGPYALAAVKLEGGDTLACYITRWAADDLMLAPGMQVRCLIKSVSIDEQSTRTAPSP